MLRRSRARFKRVIPPSERVTAPLPPPLHKLAPADKPVASSTPSASGAERREHERKSLSVAVDMHTGSNFFGGRTRDISVGGLFIETEHVFEIGAEIVVNLWLGGKRYELASQVMWGLAGDDGVSRGVGVRFVRLPEKALRAIAAFIDERLPDSVAVEGVGPEPPPLPSR